MDLVQRFTKDDIIYKMEEDFTEGLRDLPEMMVFEIITLIEQEMSKIINTIDFMEQKVKYAYIVGVLDHDLPVYVRVDYFNYNGEYPVCYKFRFVDSDTYLDYLNKSKYFKRGASSHQTAGV